MNRRRIWKRSAITVYTWILSGVPEEDRFYIPLYTMFVSELENARYGRMEKENQIERYLHDFSMNEGHPEVRAGRNSHPTLAVSWYGMAEDYEESLYVLLGTLITSTVER